MTLSGEYEKGNQYLLIAMDYFTNWPEIYAIPNQEALTMADALVPKWPTLSAMSGSQERGTMTRAGTSSLS
jgi:hypothetical protein